MRSGRGSTLTGEYTVDRYRRRWIPESRREAPDEERFRTPPLGFESAALDLALQQDDTDLGAALGRQYDPVNFVVSTRLSNADDDTPPTADRLAMLCERYGDLSFKLDRRRLGVTLLSTSWRTTMRVQAECAYGRQSDVAADPEFYVVSSTASRTRWSRTSTYRDDPTHRRQEARELANVLYDRR